jgi:hypothetical protein
MKALAVSLGTPGSAHLTDREINAAPVAGLDRYADALAALDEPGVIKTYVEVSA